MGFRRMLAEAAEMHARGAVEEAERILHAVLEQIRELIGGDSPEDAPLEPSSEEGPPPTG